MDKTWRRDAAACMGESIAEHIERNRRAESGSRKAMEGNDHWE
jgi:hypothetical protein